MQDQRKGHASGNDSVCYGCGSPNVVAWNDHGNPACLRCRKGDLSYDDGLRDGALRLLEAFTSALRDEAVINPDDHREAVQAATPAVALARGYRPPGYRPPARCWTGISRWTRTTAASSRNTWTASPTRAGRR